MKKTILAIFAICLSLSIQNSASASYTDVPENHPYIEAITYLELQGALDSAENFRPDDKIKKVEALKLIFKVLQAEIPEANGAWFAPYIDLALKNELVAKAFSDQEINHSLKKWEAIQFVMRAYGLVPPVIPKDAGDLFADIKTTSTYYAWIYQMVNLNIIQANTNFIFSPHTPLTRAEFAYILYVFDTWTQNLKFEEYQSTNTEIYKADIFNDIWDSILSNHYVKDNQYIDQEALFQSALKGMVSSLNDPYSQYFEPKEAEEFTESISGEFEGIGAILNQNANGETIVSGIVEGGPAEEAGLRANDIILSVDGLAIQGMDINAIVARIKGPNGTSVKLEILRLTETLTLEIQRAHIEVKFQSGSIKWGNTWVLDLDVFSNDLPENLMNEIFTLEETLKKPKAIVLDLRGNPGGSLRSANFVSGIFLPHLTPLVQLDYGSFVEIIYNGDTGPYQDYPIFIFIDQNSASASEIVASTLQDHGATVIGTQSFGKGTAQSYTTYWDGSALKLTIAEWLSGAGRSIEGIGVMPDVFVSSDASEESWWNVVQKAL